MGNFVNKESLLTVSNNVTIKKKLEVMWRVNYVNAGKFRNCLFDGILQ